MQTNIEALRSFSVREKMSFEDMAKKIGMNASTFYRKVNTKGEKFTIGEVHRMVECLPMSREEAVSIFMR